MRLFTGIGLRPFIRPYSTRPGVNAETILNLTLNKTDRQFERGSGSPPNLRGVYSIMQTMNTPPRTGAYGGRSVPVNKVDDLPNALWQINAMNRVNKVRQVKNLQRYHEQPGKAKWRIRMARKRRDFRSGMKVLFHLALQAEKRGL